MPVSTSSRKAVMAVLEKRHLGLCREDGVQLREVLSGGNPVRCFGVLPYLSRAGGAGDDAGNGWLGCQPGECDLDLAQPAFPGKAAEPVQLVPVGVVDHVLPCVAEP